MMLFNVPDDALKTHNNMSFTTYDNDNDIYDGNWAVLYPGGWWYNGCHLAFLNGKYLEMTSGPSGMVWYQWKTDWTHPTFSRMMIRPSIV